MVGIATCFVDMMNAVVVLRVEECHAERVDYRQLSRWVGKRLEVRIPCSRLAGCYAGSSQSCFPVAVMRLVKI